MTGPGLGPWRVVVDGREITGSAPDDRATVDVVEEPDGRTRLWVRGSGRLERVDVAQWDGPPPGLGQPVFGDGWFAALQHPGADGFGLPVEVDLAAHGGPYVSPPLVAGRCEPGRELSAFWDELDRVRARPPRLVTLANNWYQLGYVGRMSEETVLAERAGFGAIDLDLDFYCLDDPWDGGWEAETGIWGRMDPSRFPGGLRALGDGIGLWTSPFGGYFDRHDRRVEWGRAHGYEVQEGDWPKLCPAGDRYRRHLADSLTRFTGGGVGYWKLDGVQFDCDGADHGHGGRTDQMDRFAALLDGIRQVNPATVLTFTTGSNPSPWWLQHADFIWRGGLDDDAPAEFDGGRHERFATYIDTCLDAFGGTGVPVSAVVTFSVVENGVRAYQDEGESLAAWERHCWFLVGRGTHHHDLYVAPDSLSAAEWEALSRALRWARANEQVLSRSRMVGGRPQAGEAYGFVSEAGGQVIVCLRNPSRRPQSLAVPVAASDVEVVWGRRPHVDGGTVTADLDPFEVVLVSGRWRGGSPPGPPG
ncbi:MAG: hypothetical protein ACRD2W_03005 [Acidimicrobiales bacterium]